ncbi:MAG TPA: hypothetical protein HPP87_06965 [Planctomycetes bacterium]|nr:hypothetical protein [Planctomycetota bacterium]
MGWIVFVVVVFVFVFLFVRRVYEKGDGKSNKGSSEQAGDTWSGNDSSSDE